MASAPQPDTVVVRAVPAPPINWNFAESRRLKLGALSAIKRSLPPWHPLDALSPGSRTSLSCGNAAGTAGREPVFASRVRLHAIFGGSDASAQGLGAVNIIW